MLSPNTTMTIRLGHLVYTWQGGPYADVKRDGDSNAYAVIEVLPPSDAAFVDAAVEHAARDMADNLTVEVEVNA